MLSNMSLANKLRLGIGSLLFLMLLMGGTAKYFIYEMNADSTEVADALLPKLNAASSLQTAVLQMRRRELALAAITDPAEARRMVETLRPMADRVRENFATLRSLATTREDHSSIAQLDTLLRTYLEQHQQLIQAQVAGDEARRTAMLNTGRPGVEALDEQLRAVYRQSSD